MTATGWTDDVVDLPLSYSFAYHVALVAGGGGEASAAATPTNDAAAAAAAAGDAAVVVQQIRGKDLAQTSSFSPSAGNGSVVLSVQG